MNEHTKRLIEKRKRYANKLRRNMMRLKLPMGDFWTSRIKMSYEECKKELTEAEYDIASWEAWEEQKDADADEDKTEGRRETRNGIIN